MQNNNANVSSDPVGLLEFIAKNIVSHKEQVSVNTIVGSHSLVLELRLNPDDIGRVIGKNGKIVKSIRTLLQSISNKQFFVEGRQERFQNISLEIID